MTLKDIQQVEQQAKEVWIVSPFLYYDINEPDYQAVVQANIRQGAKYRYIVPNNNAVRENVETFKSRHNRSERDIREMFLMLPESEFGPFMNEMAIYDPGTANCQCSLSPKKDCCLDQEVLHFDADQSAQYTEHFRALWKRYKREEP